MQVGDYPSAIKQEVLQGGMVVKNMSYLGLFILIAAGVATGNIVSNWITARIAAYELAKAAEVMQRSMNRQAEKSEAQAAEYREQTRAQRQASALGKRLDAACKDWQNADQQMSTYTTRTESERHCSRYERFLETGVTGK